MGNVLFLHITVFCVCLQNFPLSLLRIRAIYPGKNIVSVDVRVILFVKFYVSTFT